MFFLLAILSLSIKRRPIITRQSRYVNVEDIDMCRICVGMITGIETFLGEGISQEEIRKRLRTQCDVLFKDDTTRFNYCVEMASTYLPIEIYLVNQKAGDKTTICRKLGYCSSLSNNKLKSRKPSRASSLIPRFQYNL